MDRKNLGQEKRQDQQQSDLTQKSQRENVSLNENEDVSIPNKNQEDQEFLKDKNLNEQSRTDRSDRRL